MSVQVTEGELSGVPAELAIVPGAVCGSSRLQL